MNDSNHLIAVCGLDCAECDIYRASNNHQIAVNFAEMLNANMNVEVKPEDVCCMGCRGLRDKHWSPACWILQCCVDKKGLNNCSECDRFPCECLLDWAATDPGYFKALQRLRKMKSHAC